MSEARAKLDIAQMKAIAEVAARVNQVQSDLTLDATEKAATIARLCYDRLEALKAAGELTPAVESAVTGFVQDAFSHMADLTRKAGEQYSALARDYQPKTPLRARLGLFWEEKFLPYWWDDRL